MVDRKWLYSESGLARLTEIWKLPRWARVAYVAHVARLAFRHQPKVFPEASVEQLATLRSGLLSGERVNPARSLSHLIEEITAIYSSINVWRSKDQARAAKATCMVHSILHLAYASHCASLGDDNALADNASLGVQEATFLEPTLRDRLHREFADLLATAQAEDWNDDTTAPLVHFWAGRNRLFGSLLKFSDLTTRTEWPMAALDWCLVDLEPVEHVTDLIFISHPWQTTEHPDPTGVLWERVRKYARHLTELRKELESLSSEKLSRSLQLELTKKRAANPLMMKRHRDDLALQLGGWKWVAEDGELGSSVEGSNNHARQSFLSWILDSIAAVENASVWIDSYAWPIPKHRQNCAFCEAGLRAQLPLLPEILERSTFLVVNDDDLLESKRGWLILEKVVSDLVQLQPAYRDFSESAKLGERLIRLDFKCTEEEDGTAILLGLARARSKDVLKQSNQYFEAISEPVNVKPLINELWMPMGHGVNLEDSSDALRWQLQTLVHLMRGERFQAACNWHGRDFVYHVGNIAILLGTWAASGILLTTAWRRGARSLQGPHPVTLAQACLYTYLSRIDVSAEGVAAWIADAWSEILNLDWPERGEGRFYVERRKQTLDFIRELHQHWESGNTIEISLLDIGQQVLKTQTLIRTLDAKVWTEPMRFVKEYYESQE